MAKILTSPQLGSTKAAVVLEKLVISPFQYRISLCLCTYRYSGFGVIFILSRQNTHWLMHRDIVVPDLIVQHM